MGIMTRIERIMSDDHDADVVADDSAHESEHEASYASLPRPCRRSNHATAS